MTKKHKTPQARRDAEATLRAMAEELGADSLEVALADNCRGDSDRWIVSWYGSLVFGDSLDDAFINALHTQAGTEPPPKKWEEWAK